jgi:hypothetical protein
MDGSELAQKMLEWEKITLQAYQLAEEIRVAVFELGKTQTVGNVRATYSAGRKTYDYQTAAKEVAPQDVIEKHTTIETITKTDWRQVCIDALIEAPYTQSEPSVTLKLG